MSCLHFNDQVTGRRRKRNVLFQSHCISGEGSEVTVFYSGTAVELQVFPEGPGEQEDGNIPLVEGASVRRFTPVELDEGERRGGEGGGDWATPLLQFICPSIKVTTL